MKKIFNHFKTVTFFLGFSLDLFFLPQVTSPYYVWVGPIDIGVVFILMLIRQSIRGYEHRKIRTVKKNVSMFEDRREKVREKTAGLFRILDRLKSWLTYLISFFTK